MKCKKHLVLLIEDEPEIAEIYRLKLEKEGFPVLVAMDGESGLQLAREKNPSLILLDILLPKIDGFAVLKQLKQDERTKDIPVFVFSNLTQEEDRKKASDLQADGYFVKAQFTPSEFAQRVNLIFNDKKKDDK